MTKQQPTDKELQTLIDQLASGVKTQADATEISASLQKALYEAILRGEMTDHLGYDKNHPSDNPNSRNGYGKKTVKTGEHQLEIATPRDRDGSFEPQIIGKRQTRLPLFDERIIALYAKGLTTREIQQTLEEMYQVEVSPALISNVTDAVLDTVIEWQARPLDPCYAIVYLDCIVAKVRQDKRVINKSIYLALGVTLEGKKELLGLWLSDNEGAKFWLSVLTDLRNRGVEDILIACVDGLKGFPEAIEAEYPDTQIQLCIVHMVRYSLKFVVWKDYKAVTSDLKAIYQSKTEEQALRALDAFADRWDEKYPQISKSWRSRWEHVRTLFEYPNDIRRAIYTTNAIESLNSVIRKALNKRKVFPTDQAAMKVVFLAVSEASKKWTMPIRNWKRALNRFTIMYEERLSDYV